MNLQENILRIKEMMGLLKEEEKKNNLTGNNRIVLIGPPTVGKSTIAETLSNLLNLEHIKLDEVQQKFGYGDGKELKVVKHVLSPEFEKYDTPSILDFGGGHVYNKGVESMLKEYPNIFLLMPSKDQSKSDELLKKGNYERWAGFMDTIIQGFKSGKHKHSEEKVKELIDKLERMKKGESGKVTADELPDTPEMQGWGGIELEKNWNEVSPLSSDEDSINQSIAKHIIPVYNENGERRNREQIANDIIKLLK